MNIDGSCHTLMIEQTIQKLDHKNEYKLFTPYPGSSIIVKLAISHILKSRSTNKKTLIK